MAKRLKAFDLILTISVVGLVVFHIAGCGHRAPEAVSGRVTLDGKPLSEAVILFVPLDAGRKKTGGEIVDGNYQLESEVGLLPGRYRVEIADNPPLDSPPGGTGDRHRAALRRRFPSRYTHDSPFTIEFAIGGATAMDFELKSDPNHK